MKKDLSLTQKITTYAIGSALFVVIGCSIPISIPNTSAHIDLGYAVMMIYAYLFGPIAGFVVGGLGRFLEDMILFGSIGSPGWLISSFSIGLLSGVILKLRYKVKNHTYFTIISALCVLIVNAIFLIGFAPFISSIWNGVPYLAKLPSGIAAFITNSVSMLLIGLPIAKILEKIVPKIFAK